MSVSIPLELIPSFEKFSNQVEQNFVCGSYNETVSTLLPDPFAFPMDCWELIPTLIQNQDWDGLRSLTRRYPRLLLITVIFDPAPNPMTLPAETAAPNYVPPNPPFHIDTGAPDAYDRMWVDIPTYGLCILGQMMGYHGTPLDQLRIYAACVPKCYELRSYLGMTEQEMIEIRSMMLFSVPLTEILLRCL